MGKPDPEQVIFCPRCGHSFMSGHAGGTLATGRSDCRTTIKVISLTEWREIAAQSDLRLTDIGREALRNGAP